MVIYISQPYSMCIGSCFMETIFEEILNRYTHSLVCVRMDGRTDGRTYTQWPLVSSKNGKQCFICKK